MIRNYHFNFNELNIQIDDISSLIGFGKGDEIPEPFNHYLDEAFKEAENLCDIQGAVLISENIHFNPDNSTFTIEKQEFNAGKSISRYFRPASSVALFICTAGERISNKSKELLYGSDPAKGYVYDVLGSVTVETAMDKIQNSLLEEFKPSGIKITNRYSPGYCNWNIEDQHKLFSFFPEKYCGITLSPSSLMHPIKSVSGVIGIGENVEFNKHHCTMCNSVNCIYRNLRNKGI